MTQCIESCNQSQVTGIVDVGRLAARNMASVAPIKIHGGLQSANEDLPRDSRGNLLTDGQIWDLRQVPDWILDPDTTMKKVRHFLSADIPVAIVNAYRQIDPDTRQKWSFGDSTSHKVKTALQGGAGWSGLINCSIPRFRRGKGFMHPNPLEHSPGAHYGTWFENPFNQ
jgi:hypothetical protein